MRFLIIYKGTTVVTVNLIVTLRLKTFFVKLNVYTVEIINVVHGCGHFYRCGNVCSVRQYISQSAVDWFPVSVKFLSEPVIVSYWRYQTKSYSHNVKQIIASQIYLHKKYIIYFLANFIRVLPYQQLVLQSLQLNFLVGGNQN